LPVYAGRLYLLLAGDLRLWSGEEVDDVNKTLMSTQTAVLVPSVTRGRSTTAPNSSLQGTGLSFASALSAGCAAAAHTAQVAVLGARVIDLPGLAPRGAPV